MRKAVQELLRVILDDICPSSYVNDHMTTMLLSYRVNWAVMRSLADKSSSRFQSVSENWFM